MSTGFGILDGVEQSLSPTEVGVEEFAESSNYCNLSLYPRQLVLLKLIFLEEMTGPEEDILDYWIAGGRGGNEIRISPDIRERRDFLRENDYKHFREVQLVGGRRSSKGFITGLAMAKVMWDTLQLGDPRDYYGIESPFIYFSAVAGSESQAKEFQYADFVARLETCRAFEPYLVTSLETEVRVATDTDLRRASATRARGSKVQKDIATLRGKALAANAGTLRGSTTMCLTIDEMAHMIPGESKASADQVYIAAEPSLDQFGVDGMMFLNSSPYTKIGMFYECFEANMRPFDPTKPVTFTPLNEMDSDEIAVSNGNPRNMTFQYPSWALFEGYRYYKSKYKKTERGKIFGKGMVTVSPDWNPDEVDEKGRPCYNLEDRGAILQARAKEAANPEAYKVERRGKFAEVSDAYLNPTMVDQMYKGRPAGLKPAPNGDIIRHFEPISTNWGVGVTNLFRYKFHIDPSSTTAGFGFAIAHIEYFPNVTTGMEEEHVVFDLIKRWNPQDFPGKVIRWEPILNEIATLAEIFTPYEITFDQHQSAQPIQDLSERLNQRSVGTRVYEKFAPQPLDAKVLTPTGWTTMGDITVGNAVIGSDGRAHIVDGVYPQGIQDVYRVTFSDDSSTECTLDHVWRVKAHGNRGIGAVETDMTLAEMLDKRLRYGDSGSFKWSVDHVQPVEFAEQPELSIDPYLLGSLLGDGCFHKSVWLACAKDDADEQEQMIRHLLPEGMSITRRNHGGWDTLYFKKPDGTYRNPLSELIRDLGLWHVAGADKFIPEVYLRASIDDRLALLQGLMDTDGHVGASAYRVSFTTTSWALAQGLCDLVGSLGGSTTVRMTDVTRSTIDVFIKRLPDGIVPFRLDRKVERYRPNARSGNYRAIRSVDLIGPKETQCIHVDSNEHLYVTDQYIVTHNTNELNWKRCEVFKTALYQGLVHAPWDENPNLSPMGSGTFTSKDELKFLQQTPTGGKFPKVDKQDIGPVQTKDMADAIMECVYSLIGNLHLTHLRDRLSESSIFGGAPGGYGIGISGGPGGGPGPPGISEYYSRRDARMAEWGQTQSSIARGALGGRKAGRDRASRTNRTRQGRW